MTSEKHERGSVETAATPEMIESWITPEMIEVGVDIISGFHPDWDDPARVIREVLETILADRHLRRRIAEFDLAQDDCHSNCSKPDKSALPRPRTLPKFLADHRRIWVSLADQ